MVYPIELLLYQQFFGLTVVVFVLSVFLKGQWEDRQQPVLTICEASNEILLYYLICVLFSYIYAVDIIHHVHAHLTDVLLTVKYFVLLNHVGNVLPLVDPAVLGDHDEGEASTWFVEVPQDEPSVIPLRLVYQVDGWLLGLLHHFGKHELADEPGRTVIFVDLLDKDRILHVLDLVDFEFAGRLNVIVLLLDKNELLREKLMHLLSVKLNLTFFNLVHVIFIAVGTVTSTFIK